MGKTAFSTSNALTKKAYDEKLFRDAKKEQFFATMIGTSSDSLIQEKTNLKKEKGDAITFGLRMRLTGTGVTSGTQLEGNEEALTLYNDQVTLEQYRHAVRDDGEMSRQRAMFDISEESENALKDWGSEKFEELCFAAAFASPSKFAYKTSAGLVKGTVDATVKAALTAADSKLTGQFLIDLYTLASTGNAREFVPLRQVKVMGKKYYVLLTHPDGVRDLKADTQVYNAWKDARERGMGNPLFDAADVIYGGIIVMAHENCEIGSNAGAGNNVDYGRSVLLGAQSLMVAFGGKKGQRAPIVHKTFDYDNEEGYAWELIMGVKKPKFNGVDYGSIGVYNARTKISG